MRNQLNKISTIFLIQEQIPQKISLMIFIVFVKFFKIRGDGDVSVKLTTKNWYADILLLPNTSQIQKTLRFCKAEREGEVLKEMYLVLWLECRILMKKLSKILEGERLIMEVSKETNVPNARNDFSFYTFLFFNLSFNNSFFKNYKK